MTRAEWFVTAVFGFGFAWLATGGPGIFTPW